MFTLAAKADEPGLIEAARLLGAKLTPLPLAALNAQAERILTPSAAAQSALRRAQHRRSRRARRRGRRRTAAWAAARRRRRDLRRRPISGAANLGATMTVHFIGAGPGAPDLITVRGRDLIARSPVCLYAGSLVPRALARSLPAGRADRRHRAARSRRDHRALRRGDGEGRGRRAAPFGRPFDLERHGRAIAAPRAGRGAIHDHARRARFRRRRRRAQARTDAAWPRAIAGADAHVGPRLADARARDARHFRRDRRDAGDPSVDPCARARRRRAHAVLWARLSGGGRRARLMAGRADRAREARRTRGRSARERRSSAPRSSSSAPCSGRRTFARASSTTPIMCAGSGQAARRDEGE